LSFILQRRLAYEHTDIAIGLPWILLKVVVDDNIELVTGLDS
jgi:hypothetical protein